MTLSAPGKDQESSLFARDAFLGLTLAGALAAGCGDPRGPQPDQPFALVTAGRLASNIDLGVDTAARQHDWVRSEPSDDPGEIVMRYPAGQRYGFVSFLLGIQDEEKSHVYSDDFCGFEAMVVRMRGHWEPGEVALTNRNLADPNGTKEARCKLIPDPDRGPEDYFEFTVPLSMFDTEGNAGRHRVLSAPAQFLFTGQKFTTIAVSDICLIPASGEPTPCPDVCDCEQ